MDGKCDKGAACTFAHTAEDLRVLTLAPGSEEGGTDDSMDSNHAGARAGLLAQDLNSIAPPSPVPETTLCLDDPFRRSGMPIKLPTDAKLPCPVWDGGDACQLSGQTIGSKDDMVQSTTDIEHLLESVESDPNVVITRFSL